MQTAFTTSARALLCLSILAAACGDSGPSADLAAAQYVRDSGIKIWDAFAHGDAAGILAFYDDDAVLMPPDAPIVRGKAAIAAALADEFKQFTVKSVDGRVSDINVG